MPAEKQRVIADLLAAGMGPWTGLFDVTAPVIGEIASGPPAMLPGGHRGRGAWAYPGSPWPTSPTSHLRARPPTQEEVGGRGKDVLLRLAGHGPLPGAGPLAQSVGSQTALSGGPLLPEHEAQARLASAMAAAAHESDTAWAGRLRAAAERSVETEADLSESLRLARLEQVKAQSWAAVADKAMTALRHARGGVGGPSAGPHCRTVRSPAATEFFKH